MAITNIFNKYSIRPRNLTQYAAFRGITDFSNIGQFDQYEQGYQFLSVLSLPKFMTLLGDEDEAVKQANDSFKHMLMYEFRGLDGLPDLNADTMEITDGINAQRMINRVSRETSVTVSAPYFEKRGSLITKWSEYYLTGIKDPMTQAKTYHGLIADNKCEPGFENEVFTMMYYATDNTMLRLERAVLLANCQLTKAETSMYSGSRENISNREIQIEWNCFPIWGEVVDKAASYLLADINTYRYTADQGGTGSFSQMTSGSDEFGSGKHLDSYDYKYGIMNEEQEGIKNEILVDALSKAD